MQVVPYNITIKVHYGLIQKAVFLNTSRTVRRFLSLETLSVVAWTLFPIPVALIYFYTSSVPWLPPHSCLPHENIRIKSILCDSAVPTLVSCWSIHRLTWFFSERVTGIYPPMQTFAIIIILLTVICII